MRCRARKCCDRERPKGCWAAQYRAANRPRFKFLIKRFEIALKLRRLKPKRTSVQQQTKKLVAMKALRMESSRVPPSLSLSNKLLLATIIISAITFSNFSVNCDQTPQLANHNQSNQPHHQPHLNSPQARQRAEDEQLKQRVSAKARRHFNKRLASREDDGEEAQNEDQLRVASMASKLEQWFVCQRRLAAIGLDDQQASIVSSQTSNNEANRSNLIGPFASSGRTGISARPWRCPASYDGHLCWPASSASELAIRMPCPRVNRLPSERDRLGLQLTESMTIPKAPPNSVISSPTPVMQLAAQQANASEKLIALVGLSAKSESIKQATTNGFIQDNVTDDNGKAKFAYRKCGPPLATTTTTTATKDDGNLMLGGQWQASADYSECRSENTLALFDPTDKWIKLDQEPDKRLFKQLIDELDRIEGAIDPYGDPDLLAQWSLCIANIMHSSNQLANSNQTAFGDLWCPIIFDGWRCWPSTRAGDTAYVTCPSNQPGFSAERKAHKICTQNGTWYKHPMTNRYWSNYTTCVDTADLAFRTKILNLYVFGNLISLVALSASLIIFISFKSLNCTRVTIHKNLFLSFITNNLMWIIWYTYVVNDADLLQSNPIACQLWHVLLHYFLVSNYFWMFCEGLYLHTLLVVAFVSEDKILKWFYLLGWLSPIPITVTYAYNRSYDEYYTHFCWMEESPYNLILMTPIGISLLLNLVFLINIVRVLVTKLRANNSPDTHQTRKAVRATLILIPLLGLHYILTPFRPEAKSEWEGIYESIAAVCTSFQGLCVAMLFCFCNAEVITVIKKKLKDTFNLKGSNFNRRKRSNSASGGGGINNFTSNYNYSNTTTTLVNNCHFNDNNNYGARPLKSVISSAGLLVQSQGAHKNEFEQQQSQIGRSNGTTNGNISNSSSLFSTVTASPIQVALSSSIAVKSSLLHDPQPTTTTSNNIRTLDTAVSDLGQPSANNRRPSFGLDKDETKNLLQHQDQTCTITTSFSVA